MLGLSYLRTTLGTEYSCIMILRHSQNSLKTATQSARMRPGVGGRVEVEGEEQDEEEDEEKDDDNEEEDEEEAAAAVGYIRNENTF